MDTEGIITTDARLTDGPVGMTLLRLAIPMVWGMFSIVAFNLADTYFVARLGTDALAALGFTFPVVMTVGSITIGLGVGSASVLSRAIGQGDRRKVQSLTIDSLTLALVFVGIFVLVGVFTIDPLFTMLGANSNTLPLIRQYMSIWYLGMMFLVVPMIGNNIIRASGNTIVPSMIMTLSALINIVLDPVLIFGLGPFPQMGIRGAAVATVFARSISMVASLAYLRLSGRIVTFARPAGSSVIQSWKEILYIGLPAAGTYAIGPVALGIVTGIVATFGPSAVAAFGVATRIESLSLITMFGLSTSVAPFAGQNYGAGLTDRVRRCLYDAFAFSLVWGLVMAAVLAMFAEQIAGIFTDNSNVAAIAAMYMYIVPVSFGAQGVVLIASSAFNALGKPVPSAVLTLTRMLLLYVPLAIVGRVWLGIAGVFAAACAANFGTAVWSAAWAFRTAGPKGHVSPEAAQRAQNLLHEPPSGV